MELQSQLGIVEFEGDTTGVWPKLHSLEPAECPQKEWILNDSLFVAFANKPEPWITWLDKCSGKLTHLDFLKKILLKRKMGQQSSLSSHTSPDNVLIVLENIIEYAAKNSLKRTNPEELKKWNSKLDSFSDHKVIVGLGRLILYSIVQNRGKMKDYYQHLLKVTPWETMVQKFKITSEERIHYKNLLTKVMKFLEEHSNMIDEQKLLTEHLKLLGELNSNVDEITSTLTLMEIRDLANSFTKSRNDPLIIFDYFYRRSTEQEINYFLNNFANKNRGNISEYNLAMVYFVHDKGLPHLNGELFDFAKKSWLENDVSKQLIILQAMEKYPSLKMDLGKDIEELNKPLFLIERNFYKNLINNGRAPFLSVYGLITLGDQDASLLNKVFQYL